MIGIYKITNKINGKVYIGQSNDCERRIKEHCYPSRYKGSMAIDIAIHKYGKDSFSYEVIEECNIDMLNERECYWIQFYDSLNNGYNCSLGGDSQSIGSNNIMAKLTEEDVVLIRKAYNEHKKQKDVYELFKDKISFSAFQSCWQGRSWSHIMPEVFTLENKEYYTHKATQGEDSPMAGLSNEEVILIRQRYVNESAREIYEDFKDRMKYETFQAMLWGRTYKTLPIYKKKEKKWINL